jgi:hypothetical protein
VEFVVPDPYVCSGSSVTQLKQKISTFLKDGLTLRVLTEVL